MTQWEVERTLPGLRTCLGAGSSSSRGESGAVCGANQCSATCWIEHNSQTAATTPLLLAATTPQRATSGRPCYSTVSIHTSCKSTRGYKSLSVLAWVPWWWCCYVPRNLQAKLQHSDVQIYYTADSANITWYSYQKLQWGKLGTLSKSECKSTFTVKVSNTLDS